jgi:hypothetical protein
MTWGISQFRSSIRLRIVLGYGPGSLIRCINLLIENRVRLQELKLDGEGSVGPVVVIEVTLRNPGRRKIKTIITALNHSTLGCREEDS